MKAFIGAIALLCALSAAPAAAEGQHLFSNDYTACDAPDGSAMVVDFATLGRQCTNTGDSAVACSFEIDYNEQTWSVLLRASWVKSGRKPAAASDGSFARMTAKASNILVCTPKGVAVTGCSGTVNKTHSSGSCYGTVEGNGAPTVYKTTWSVSVTLKE